MENLKKYLTKLEDRQTFLKEVEENVVKRCTQDFPPQIILEVTSFCNMKCIHCGHDGMKRRKGNMDIQLYKKLIDEIARENPETELWLTFYGEALLLKYKLYYMIKYAKEKGLKYLILNTNGMLLDDEMAELIIESGLDRFIFSLDGFTKETYDKIRIHGKREIVYDNILNLIDKKEKRNLKKPHLEIQFSVMDENENELNEFISFWSKKDVYIKIREKFTWCSTVDANNLDANQDRIACPWLVSAVGIFWTGDVVMCVQDYEGQNLAGNVKESSIKEVWNNNKRKDFVQKHIEHKFEQLPHYCQQCMDWQAVGAETYQGKTRKRIDWKKIILEKEDDKPQLKEVYDNEVM